MPRRGAPFENLVEILRLASLAQDDTEPALSLSNGGYFNSTISLLPSTVTLYLPG